MPGVPELDVTFTAQAKARITAFLSSITGYEPTLCLMKAYAPDEPKDRWTYGSYGPDNLKSVGPALERLGHPLLYLADDLVVAIPQFNFVPELVGKTLALTVGGLEVLEREPGI